MLLSLDSLGDFRVVVQGKQVRSGGRQLMLYLPSDLSERLNRVVLGAQAPALTGLIIWALDELERRGETLRVDLRKEGL